MEKIKNSHSIILFVSSVSSFLTAFMGSSLNVALPAIGNTFNSSTVLLSWIATTYVLTSVVFLIPFGKLSDIFGRVKFFKIGIIVFTIGCLFIGISTSDVLLIIFRAIQGIGSSLMFINSVSILVSAYQSEKRGHVLGIVISSVYIGLSVGPFLGGIITQNLGWRFIFYFTFAVCLVLIALIYLFISIDWKVSENENFDFKGSLLFVTAISAFMLGFTFIKFYSGIILIIIGVLMFFIYKRMSEKIPNPVLHIEIFKSNKTFTFSNIAALINYSATFAISFLLSMYFQKVKTMNPQEAGLILVTQPVFMAIFSPIAGRLSDKIEPQHLSSAGMGLITICLVFLCFISQETSNIYFIINLAILGFGFALFSSPNSNAIMGSVEKKNYGTASTVLSLMRMMGQSFSMAIVIVIFSFVLGSSELSSVNQTGLLLSLRIAFLLFAILCFLGIFASLARGKMHS